MDVEFDIDEFRRLIVDLGQAGVIAAAKAPRLVNATAHRVVATAQQLVPVDTGATKGSIHASFPQMLEAEIGPTTHYAPYLEYGTVNMAPYAFLGPALDRHTPDFVAAARALAQL